MHLPAAVLTTALIICNIATATTVLRSLDNVPVQHFTITRRGGKFEPTVFGRDYVNMTYLAQELEKTESRFNLTKREVKGNKLIRKAKSDSSDGRDLTHQVATEGIWYAKMRLGNPPQEIEVDLDMLSSSFYVVTTTSRKGSRYDDFFSQSVVKSLEHPYPSCFISTDLLYLPTTNTSLSLAFPQCRPSKFSVNTLGPSGSLLGLAPSEHLSQMGDASILKQLLEKGSIGRPIFSLMLINGHDGVLSAGGTAARAIEKVMSQTEAELNSLGDAEKEQVAAVPIDRTKGLVLLVKRGKHHHEIVSRQEEWKEGWAWTDVQGAEGWWQILMRGVWVGGSKVLKNQAVVVDINSPFILAPPLAAKAFYASVSGSHPLPPPYSSFYVFPCLNPPALHFEFGGTNFPFMQGGRGAEWSGVPGGRFSLGRLEPGSGYCLGAVVETRMGIKEERDEVVQNDRKGSRSIGGRGGLGGNGMRDVWVIGEGFFRGVGGVFDFKELRVGFKAY